MRVALVNPPSSGAGSPHRLLPPLHLTPSLGLAYLAAVLERDGREVRIFECGIDDLSDEALVRALGEGAFEVVGLTSFTPLFKEITETCAAIRRALPRVRLVLGGPHVTASPTTLDPAHCDAAVMGEGEYVLRDLVRAWAGGASGGLDGIPGLVTFRDGRPVPGPRRRLLEDLDDLPLPARHLWPPLARHKAYAASIRHEPQACMIATRGCPARCTFCDRSVFGERLRVRSPARVVDEMESLSRDFGAGEIRFVDDSIAANRRFFDGLLDEMIRRGCRIPWLCHSRPGETPPDLLRKMHRAGCWQILFGIESGDDRVLALLKKGSTVEGNRRAIREAKEAGLVVRADFLLGHPGETMESMRRTLAFALEASPDYAHFNALNPLPGTAVYDRIRREAPHLLERRERWRSRLEFEGERFVPPGVDPVAYERFIAECYRRFYFRPSHVLRHVAKVRTWAEWKHKVLGSWALVRSVRTAGGRIRSTREGAAACVGPGGVPPDP